MRSFLTVWTAYRFKKLQDVVGNKSLF